MTALAGARVVTPRGVLDPGWVEIEGNRITGVGAGSPGGSATDLGGGWLLPGYIDIHVHGGQGHDFGASADELAAGVAFHRTHGTTRTLVSFVTAPVDTLSEQLGWAATLADRGPSPEGYVVGAHLEGPYLSQIRCGAQNPDYLVTPDRKGLARMLDAGRGYVRSMTIAPELPGALDLVDDLVAAGVVAAVGHTDATYLQAAEAYRHGATLATHLYNGMRPVHHREPGPVLASLDCGAVCEVVNDGVHVHPAVLREVLARGTDRLVFITDAIDATGVGDGHYVLGGQDVIVTDGVARLASNPDALAGSTLTMDSAVRRAILDGGLPVEVASAAASANPARVLGMADRCGAIEAGLDADLVLLDDDYALARVMAQGQWVSS